MSGLLSRTKDLRRMHAGPGNEHLVFQCEDRTHDSSQPDEIHRHTSNFRENGKAGGPDLHSIEMKTVWDKDNRENLETLVIPIDEQLKICSVKRTLSKTSKIPLINSENRVFYVMPPAHCMDSCITIPKNQEIRFEKGLSLGSGQHDLTDSQAVDLDNGNIYLLGQEKVYDLPRTSGDSSSEYGVLENPVESNKDQVVREPQESSKLLTDEDHFEQECPICTELYDAKSHKQSLLNCKHAFCDNCIKTMVSKANEANLGKVTCPLCRQTTPMMEWEIRKLQDQVLDSGGIYIQQDYVSPEPIVRRPGLCGALEYRFQKRFRNGRLAGLSPCVRNPQRMIERLDRLQHRCHCLYLCALSFLLFAEYFCFFFLFMPIVLFTLLIIFGK
ncbi:ring finger protein-like isoform X2 [Pyxicephalus adspersus]|uniref:ring finger protein-like isoform X2 n=1 Tax=Pyxicephalus adspersus TaxID=30357 RepID=UPI003B5BD171